MATVIGATEMMMKMMKTAMVFAESSSADSVSKVIQNWFSNAALL